MTATTTQPVRLDDVLAYHHPGVISRYCKEHHASRAEGEEVFREMLKWLYLCYRGELDGVPCAMFPEMEKIDWMWHTFILFTRDYAEFCERFFGLFLHHIPSEAEEGDEQPDDPAAVQAQLERQFAFVYDVLGEETLNAWHDECRYAAPA